MAQITLQLLLRFDFRSFIFVDVVVCWFWHCVLRLQPDELASEMLQFCHDHMRLDGEEDEKKTENDKSVESSNNPEHSHETEITTDHIVYITYENMCKFFLHKGAENGSKGKDPSADLEEAEELVEYVFFVACVVRYSLLFPSTF